MPNPAAQDARTLTHKELAEAINEAYRELFNLRFQKGTHQITNPMAIGRARRQIARLRTIQRERVRAADRGETVEPQAPAAPPTISPQKRRAREAAAATATAEAPDAGAEEAQ